MEGDKDKGYVIDRRTAREETAKKLSCPVLKKMIRESVRRDRIRQREHRKK